jgi:hypothetical protein
MTLDGFILYKLKSKPSACHFSNQPSERKELTWPDAPKGLNPPSGAFYRHLAFVDCHLAASCLGSGLRANYPQAGAE